MLTRPEESIGTTQGPAKCEIIYVPCHFLYFASLDPFQSQHGYVAQLMLLNIKMVIACSFALALSVASPFVKLRHYACLALCIFIASARGLKQRGLILHHSLVYG
jgi:hypothetical protein